MSQELAELSICPKSLLTLPTMSARSLVASPRNVGAAMEVAARQVLRETDERMSNTVQCIPIDPMCWWRVGGSKEDYASLEQKSQGGSSWLAQRKKNVFLK